jgi:hypothetical protein
MNPRVLVLGTNGQLHSLAALPTGSERGGLQNRSG